MKKFSIKTQTNEFTILVTDAGNVRCINGAGVMVSLSSVMHLRVDLNGTKAQVEACAEAARNGVLSLRTATRMPGWIDLSPKAAIKPSAVSVCTQQYYRSHTKAPRGRGGWLWQIGEEQKCFGSTTYAEGAKLAKAYAAGLGISLIEVLP